MQAPFGVLAPTEGVSLPPAAAGLSTIAAGDMALNGAVSTCPHCGHGQLVRNGSYRLKDGTRRQRYLCRSCDRTCNPTTGTTAANLKRHAQWARMAAQMNESLPLRQVAAQLGIHLSTAFRWRHRWLAAQCRKPQASLTGTVAVTTALIRYSEKGSRTCRGPGSWGYWDCIRGGPRPANYPEDLSRGRFRVFIDGRPNCVMVAKNGEALVTAILGQGAPDVDAAKRGVDQLVSAKAEVYGFDTGTIEAACRQANLPYQNGWRFLREYRHWPRQEGTRPRLSPIRCPDSPHGWLLQFRGVATKYLNHYMAWFSLQASSKATASW